MDKEELIKLMEKERNEAHVVLLRYEVLKDCVYNLQNKMKSSGYTESLTYLNDLVSSLKAEAKK